MKPDKTDRSTDHVLFFAMIFFFAIVNPTGFADGQQGGRPRVIEPNDAIGSSAAVVVGDWPLVHTTQLFPVTAGGDIVAGGSIAQGTALLDRLATTLSEMGSGLERVVKLNVTIAQGDVMADFQRELAARFPGPHKPAVTWVVTQLPMADALVAADAVATTSLDPGRAVKLLSLPVTASGAKTLAAIVPRGTRIYVAGQAERGDSLAGATRKTLEQLNATLRFLGRSLADVVQLKAFLTPMTDVAEVERVVAEFFRQNQIPPFVVVEWRSAATTPIEIELIAWGGMNNTGDTVEYLTPPGMTASPVYSRVTRVNHSQSIYVSGLFASPAKEHDGDSNAPQDAEREVKESFASLKRILQSADSDLNHLVKATYYVASDAASQKLNELRPIYYDPHRPPSASKAMIAGVGRKQLALTMDMIAVPAWNDDHPEYGAPEYGHGLSADDARAGWISLFDGLTTFGWSESHVGGGILSGGTTTTAFGNCELRAWFEKGGTISVCGSDRQAPDGEFKLAATHAEPNMTGPVRLGKAVRLRQLAVRPLGLESLFNGRDMAGWKRIDHPRIAADRRPSWQVEGGALRARGGPGCVEYVAGIVEGESAQRKSDNPVRFGNMVLQLDVRTRARHANGGVFFRAVPGEFMNGYEAQVFNRSEDGDPGRPATWCTGGIDDRQNARRMVSRDGQFFTMTIIAQGPHVATWVNGYQQTDWTDDRPPHPNPRQGLRTEPGAIQLQAHDPETDVEFKKISAALW